MKRTSWLALAASLVAGNGVCAAEPSFTNLRQAVDFIATALESTNFVVISSACLDARRRPPDHLLKDLQRTNVKTPLRTLYAGKAFPAQGATFKLGGHMAELGCTHIDFLKTNQVWKLQAIWMCR